MVRGPGHRVTPGTGPGPIPEARARAGRRAAPERDVGVRRLSACHGVTAQPGRSVRDRRPGYGTRTRPRPPRPLKPCKAAAAARRRATRRIGQ
eukprot:187524-Hanusia_phi.AAC.1